MVWTSELIPFCKSALKSLRLLHTNERKTNKRSQVIKYDFLALFCVTFSFFFELIHIYLSSKLRSLFTLAVLLTIFLTLHNTNLLISFRCVYVWLNTKHYLRIIAQKMIILLFYTGALIMTNFRKFWRIFPWEKMRNYGYCVLCVSGLRNRQNNAISKYIRADGCFGFGAKVKKLNNSLEKEEVGRNVVDASYDRYTFGRFYFCRKEDFLALSLTHAYTVTITQLHN